MPDGIGGQHALLHQLPAGQSQRHKAAGDGGGAGSAVALEHVAVDGDGMLPQLRQVHGGPEGTAHQPLDLCAAGRELQLGDVPLAALPVGPGQHGVLRRHPAGALRHMGRHPVLHAGAAENHGVAALDETAALREFYEIRGDFDRAQLVKCPSVLSGHGMRSFSFSPQRGLDRRERTVIVISVNIDGVGQDAVLYSSRSGPLLRRAAAAYRPRVLVPLESPASESAPRIRKYICCDDTEISFLRFQMVILVSLLPLK